MEAKPFVSSAVGCRSVTVYRSGPLRLMGQPCRRGPARGSGEADGKSGQPALLGLGARIGRRCRSDGHGIARTVAQKFGLHAWSALAAQLLNPLPGTCAA